MTASGMKLVFRSHTICNMFSWVAKAMGVKFLAEAPTSAGIKPGTL